MPKISVIVPVYNVEPYLSRCIDSVLNQTFSDFELILIDDGSPDKCPEICDMYAVKDNRIHVIHQKNGGLSAARNAGIDWAFKNSDSEFLTFIDSDDWFCGQYLEFLYNAYLKTGLNVVIGGYERVSIEEASDACDFECEIVETEKLFVENRVNAIVAWGKLVRKSLYKDIRFPVGKIHEDEFTTYKILFMNEQVAYVKEPLYKYFFAENSIMNSGWSIKRLDALEAFEEQIIFFKANKQQKALMSSEELYLKDMANGIKNLRQSGCIGLVIKYKTKLFISLIKYYKSAALNDRDFRNIIRLSFPVIYKIKVYTRKIIKLLLEILGISEEKQNV